MYKKRKDITKGRYTLGDKYPLWRLSHAGTAVPHDQAALSLPKTPYARISPCLGDTVPTIGIPEFSEIRKTALLDEGKDVCRVREESF